MQKQPPGPTLFLGNLGFETTEDTIRELLESHRAKDVPADDKWIRKIRLGTFEDSGKCKGYVLPLSSPQQSLLLVQVGRARRRFTSKPRVTVLATSRLRLVCVPGRNCAGDWICFPPAICADLADHANLHLITDGLSSTSPQPNTRLRP